MRHLLTLSVPAIVIGVVSALVLFALDEVAEALQGVIWTTLPHAVGADPDSGWWIFGVLSLTGLAVGLCVWLLPGNGGGDSATTELTAPPLPLASVPSLIIVTVLALAGGVSLGPESPIIAINTAILVALLARAWPALPVPFILLVTAAGTIGALFGTPVAAVLAFTGIVGGLATVGSPLPAARVRRRRSSDHDAAGPSVVRGPHARLHLGRPDRPAERRGHRRLSGRHRCSGRRRLPRVHATFRLLRNPVLYVTVGGVVLGVLGAIGGPITLIKGLAQLAQLVTERAEYTAGQLALMVVIKLVALVVAAAAGFRGGRIFPAVFIGAAIGVLAQALVPGIPVPIAVSARVLGMLLAVSRDGRVALFVAVAVTGSIAALPVLCLALFPAWLVVTKAPEMIVRVPARGPEPSPPTDVHPRSQRRRTTSLSGPMSRCGRINTASPMGRRGPISRRGAVSRRGRISPRGRISRRAPMSRCARMSRRAPMSRCARMSRRGRMGRRAPITRGKRPRRRRGTTRRLHSATP